MTSSSTFSRVAKRASAVAATALLATGVAAPAAQAQDLSTLLQGLGTANNLSDQALAAMDCGTLDGLLNAAQLKDSTTTRSQLESNIRNIAPDAGVSNPALLLFGAQQANKVADKALACNIVKPDPTDPFSQFTQLLGSVEFLGQLAAAQR